MTDSKLILKKFEDSVCRVHFLLVGEVISFGFVVMASVLAATTWYHYAPLCFALFVSVLAFWAAWSLHIRLLIAAMGFLFLKVAAKVVILILLSHGRISLYDECYYKPTCDKYPDWRVQMINLANGIAFLFPSTIISFINMVSCMYLVYLFRSAQR